MSELINNREYQTIQNPDRMKALKQIFVDLQNGRNIEEIKAHFNAFIGTVTIEEISQLQHEEMENIPADELRKLYSMHTEIFKGAIEDPERLNRPEDEAGHPIHTFKRENRELEKLINNRVLKHLEQFINEDSLNNTITLLEDCNLLLDIDKHFSRKENLLFPYLERYGIYGPSKNMWRIDDYIRDALKTTKNY